MSDLIDRWDAIQKMLELYNEDLEAYGVEIPEMFDCDRAIEALQNLPSVEPERKKGKWDDIGGAIRWGCPICHHAYETKYNFCPTCGADMRGEGNDG